MNEYTINHQHIKGYTIQSFKEKDGRYGAEVVDIPGIMVYGDTENSAIDKALSLAKKVMSEI